MRACVFVGPTLRPDEVAGVGTILPPAARGDVYRATLRRPQAIGVIDGYFDGVTSVWHKEILWAMSQGVHVFGSGSIGALRAAELAPFGMIGVGSIFEQYRSGRLEDDDEVAILHGPAETGFLPISEPMVNIRATLESALSGRIIRPALGDLLLAAAKRMLYRERTWHSILARAADNGGDRDQLRRLTKWLGTGEVDLKRADALKMLDAMRVCLERDPAPKQIDYHFEWTSMWDEAVRSFETTTQGAATPAGALALEELKLDPGAWQDAMNAALVRMWGGREARRRRMRPSEAALAQATLRLRQRLGLYTRKALDDWIEMNDLDTAAFDRLRTEEALLQMLHEMAADQIEDALRDQLRVEGRYTKLKSRATEKLAILQDMGAVDADPKLIGLAPHVIRSWFFKRRLNCPAPDDIAAFARASGFADLAEFDAALAREYVYFKDLLDRREL